MNRTLPDAIMEELGRCRELVKVYELLPTGGFGKMMIELAIRKGEMAIVSGEVVECIDALAALKGCK